jgi:hypothetical protein
MEGLRFPFDVGALAIPGNWMPEALPDPAENKHFSITFVHLSGHIPSPTWPI